MVGSGQVTPPESKAGGPANVRYGLALSVLATVFFMWGFATVLNDILVPHLKAVFELNYAKSLLIQFVFYLAYLLMSLPSAKLLERIGYKPSIIVGLMGMALGALMFVPAAVFVSYGIFLTALFVLGTAIALLQVAANPYVAVIGPPETASSRLNLVQALNSAGTMIAPMFGGMLILGRSASGTASADAVSALSQAQRIADAQAVRLPYILIAVILIVLALIVWRTRLPALGAATRRAAREERKKHSLWRHRNLVFGVPAIFIYLIAEIGVGSTLVNFISMPDIGAMSHERAADYLVLFWGGAMVGRFVGAAIMRFVSSEHLLAFVSVCALRVQRHRRDDRRASRDVVPDLARPVPLDHVPDHLHARHQGARPADRGRLGPADHGDRRRRAVGAAGRDRGSFRPAALLSAAGGLLHLCAVLCGLGLPSDGRPCRPKQLAAADVISASSRPFSARRAIDRVVKRQIDQIGHGRIGRIGIGRRDRVEDPAVLRNRIARQRGFALLEDRGPGNRSAHAARSAKRGTCFRSRAGSPNGRRDRPRGPAAVASVSLRHGLERPFHIREILVRAALRGERGGRRLDHAAQLEQAVEEGFVGLELEYPGQHVGIQQMPGRLRADPRADLRPRHDEALGGQNAYGFPIDGARDMQRLAGGNLAIEEIAGLEGAGDDLDADIARYFAVQAKPFSGDRVARHGMPPFAMGDAAPGQV